MKNVIGHLARADESAVELGPIDLGKALATFDEFPWAQECAKSEQTGVSPTLSLGGSGKDGPYINVIGLEDGSFMTCTEAILRPGCLGLFRRAAFRETNGAGPDQVKEQIRQFFDLDCSGLYAAIQRENRSAG